MNWSGSVGACWGACASSGRGSSASSLVSETPSEATSLFHRQGQPGKDYIDFVSDDSLEIAPASTGSPASGHFAGLRPHVRLAVSHPPRATAEGKQFL